MKLIASETVECVLTPENSPDLFSQYSGLSLLLSGVSADFENTVISNLKEKTMFKITIEKEEKPDARV